MSSNTTNIMKLKKRPKPTNFTSAIFNRSSKSLAVVAEEFCFVFLLDFIETRTSFYIILFPMANTCRVFPSSNAYFILFYGKDVFDLKILHFTVTTESILSRSEAYNSHFTLRWVKYSQTLWWKIFKLLG